MKSFDVENENYHMGHLIWDTFKCQPDAVCQIDAITGESETYASVLGRSIQLAKCFRKFGVKPGDVLALGGRNHLDIHIPFYAALFNGLPIASVDFQYKYKDIKVLFQICCPRIAFCQKEFLEDYEKVIEELGLNTKVICFDEGKNSLAKFIEDYDDKDNQEQFVPAAFDLNTVYAWLISTSGTTGFAKLVAIKHRMFFKKVEEFNLAESISTLKNSRGSSESKLALILTQIHTITAFLYAVLAPLRSQTIVQSSAPLTTEHIIDIINKYRPAFMVANPNALSLILNSDMKCDFSCVEHIIFIGRKVDRNIFTGLRKKMRPDAMILERYGQTENIGPCLAIDPKGPIGTCGKALLTLPVKLVDVRTGIEITEPNVLGELWTKGNCFSEYYNNPEQTAKAFSDDGWYKTGDLMYRDEEGYYFFVERLNMLIKYRFFCIIPFKLETIIREHPDVVDVSVTSIPHEEDGEHAVACVVRRKGSNLTADEVKEMVASQLSDSERLRGGVVFMDQLPLASMTGKVARGKLRQMVLTANRE